MADDSQRPIVIKKIKKGGHGHHGGAWKIAYADFVTAMMAFFLLMWLLGSTAKGDLSGIAEFFSNPLRVSLSGGSGSGDATSVIQAGGNDVTRINGQVRDGHKDRSITTSGRSTQEHNAGANNFEIIKKSVSSPVKEIDISSQISQGKSREKGHLQLSKNSVQQKEKEQSGSSFQASASEHSKDLTSTQSGKDILADRSLILSPPDQQQDKEKDHLEETNHLRLIPVKSLSTQGLTRQAIAVIDRMKKDTLQRELEQEKLATMMRYVNTKIGQSKYLSQFKDQIMMDLTNQGLRIQIVDRRNRQMFKAGSHAVEPYMRPVLRAIGEVLSSVTNFIQVSGHTDATGFSAANRYDNWDLSVDRANAARRELIAGGLNPERVTRVSGFADIIPFDMNRPDSAQNRRISIIVMTSASVRELFHH